MQLLEEKHMEELQLYKLQLAQTVQQASHLEAKLQGYNSRKSEMVEKLHSVMETQWQEALRIVSGNSPLVNCGAEYVRLQVKLKFIYRNSGLELAMLGQLRHRFLAIDSF